MELSSKSKHEVIDSYRNQVGVSQSTIKNPAWAVLKNKKFEESEALRRGSLVDLLLTNPNEFDDKYIIIDNTKFPPKDAKRAIDKFWKSSKCVGTLDDFEVCAKAVKYEVSRKTLQSVLDNNKEYIEMLLKADGKIIIEQNELDLAKIIVTSLMTSKYTGKYSLNINSYPSNFEVEDQIPIFWLFKNDIFPEGLASKALLDRVIINHETKTIQPLDFKTTGKRTIDFKESFMRFRYDLQAWWYMQALKFYISLPAKQRLFLSMTNADLSKYTILPFKFIVESTEDPGNPLVWVLNHERLDDLYYKGEEGYKSIEELLKIYKWYHENGFEQYKEVVESNGELSL